jgi:hypothetical protein
VNESLLHAIFDDFREVKRAHVRDHDPDDRDIPMMIFVGEHEDDEEVLAIIVPGAREDACQALAAVMARAFIPYWAAICMDGYVAKDVDVPDEFRHPGGLVELAAIGSDNVRECLTITAADHTGTKYAISQTYWYDSDGDIWFEDDDAPGDEMSGPMLDVLLDITSLWGKTHTEIIEEIMKRSPDRN